MSLGAQVPRLLPSEPEARAPRQIDMKEVDQARARPCAILLAKTTARHQPETVIAWDYETRQVGR